MIDFILLGFLMHGEMTGYDLKRYMGQSTANFYDASYGSIYPALKRLEKSGWVAVREEPTGNRVRKLYTLQASGRLRFLKWLASPLGVSKTSTEPLIRVFFLSFLDPETAKNLILGFQNRLGEEAMKLAAIETQVNTMADAFQQTTLQYGISHYRHQIAWCQVVLNILENPQERTEKHEHYCFERQSEE